MKWDHDVSGDEDIASALKHAYRVAAAEPCGPVYLTLEREILIGGNGSMPVDAGAAEVNQYSRSERDENILEAAADALVNAANPLIMTAYAGRHAQSVFELVTLAETLAARVITTDLRMNFPSNHPLCPGIDCIKGDSYDHYIAEADVILLIDYNFPGPMGKRFEPSTGGNHHSF